MQNVPDKKTLIVKASELLFHRYGYSKTSLEDIAKEAGMSKGSIYYYFESKEDILIEVAKLHTEEFYLELKKKIDSEMDFAAKITTAIKLPIRLIYEHTPIMLDIIKTLPCQYLQKLDKFRQDIKEQMIELLDEIIAEGLKQKIVTKSIPVDKLVNIIYDWFLLGDSNIIVQYPEEFVKKAETDYDWIIQLLLYGIIERGQTK